MSLRDRIPVEPLGPERLDRLEHRIVAASAPALARPARQPLWPWGLALASAAAAALAVFALRPAPDAPSAPPVGVSTDAGATIDLGDATIRVGAATRFDINRGGGGIDVRLDHGEVSLDVAPRRDRPPLWVHAGDVGVRVVGTAFTVTRAPDDGEVAVEVTHGTVEVHRGGMIAKVTGGERWSSRDGTVLAVAPDATPSAPDAVPGATNPGGFGAKTIGAADTHTPQLSTGPAIDVAVLGDRRATAPLAGVPTPRTATGPAASQPRTNRPERTEPRPPANADPITDLRQAIMAQPLAPAMTVDGATPEARVAALRKAMAEGRGATAAAALYGLARTQHVELGRHAEALRSLEAYVTRFPNGAEIEDVKWLRIRILCRGTIGDACRAAAHSYAKAEDTTEARRDIAVKLTNVR